MSEATKPTAADRAIAAGWTRHDERAINGWLEWRDASGRVVAYRSLSWARDDIWLVGGSLAGADGESAAIAAALANFASGAMCVLVGGEWVPA